MHELRERGLPEVDEAAELQVPLPRWVALVLALVVVFLAPWILYLTFTLPSRHVTFHYDLAWVGFDVGLLASFAATAWAAYRRNGWLVPLAAATGTMLICDAWFDVVTSQTGGEMWEALAEAVFGELPLALLCGFIVFDAETFIAATARLRRRRRR